MAVPAVLNVAAWAVLATGVGIVATKNADLSARLKEAEAQLGSAQSRIESVDRVGKASKESLAVARSREQAALDEVRKDIRGLWARVLESPEAGESTGVAESPQFEEAVREVLDRYVMERKFRDAIGKAATPAIPKKPAFGVLAKALDLKPEQAERLERDIRDIQMDLYEVLTIPRADGVVLMDEITMADQYPEGSPQRTAPFLKLFKLKIPETEETYVERAITLVQGLKERAPEYLAVEQMETLNSLDLDWFGVKFMN